MSTSRRCVVLSLGMGIDSVALLVHWIRKAASRGFDLRDLICVTAMTGDEHDRTRELMERYLLPLLRQYSIRYVQIARRGQEASNGYEVLSDTRAPERMYMRGRWRLSDEMRSAGTLPSLVKGRRWCSERAKGDPLDWWMRDHVPAGYTHVVGFAAEEPERAARDTAARREKEAKGEVVPCEVWYPLIEWGWDRARCAAYLQEQFNLPDDQGWARSCCTYCPFQATAGSRQELTARWRAQPDAGADALVLEHTSLALNERIGAFGVNRTAVDLARTEGLDEVLAIADTRLQAVEQWSLVEVQRVFDARNHDPKLKGMPWRSVAVRSTGPRDELLRHLSTISATTTQTDAHGITRAWRHNDRRAEPVSYPAVEWFWVVVPDGLQGKKRKGFDRVWARVHSETLFTP